MDYDYRNQNGGDHEKAIASITTSRSRTIRSLRALEKYQLFLLLWDVLCNLTVDCSSSNPLTVLILFVLQCIPLCINVILCGVSAANYALQYGVDRKLIIRYHEVNLGSMLTYIILTFWWYIWTIRRLWPSVGDHFNFSSSDYYSSSSNNGTTTFTGDGTNTAVEWDELTGSAPREYYTLWSPGFIALYTIQRTVAVIYYVIGIKSVYILLNESEPELPIDESDWQEDNILASEVETGDKDKEPEPVIFGYGRYRSDSDHAAKQQQPGISTISELMSNTLIQTPHAKQHTPTPTEGRSRHSSATITSARSSNRRQQQLSLKPVPIVASELERKHESPAKSHQRLRFENQSSLDEDSSVGEIEERPRKKQDSKY